MAVEFPANPASIELKVEQRKLWWQADQVRLVEDRHVSADIWEPERCRPEHRHVSDLSVTLVQLDRERQLLDSITMGAWVVDFIAEAVDGHAGNLHPQLERRISRGPARMLVVQDFEVSAEWRGQYVGTALLASGLMEFAQAARFAVCRPSLEQLACQYTDRLEAEEALERWTSLLESVGFWEWRGAYVVDLRDRALLGARGKLLDRLVGDDEATR